MKIFSPLTTIRVGAGIQFFTNSDYKNEFLSKCLEYAIENIVYELDANQSLPALRDLEITRLHFARTKIPASLSITMIKTNYVRCISIIAKQLKHMIDPHKLIVLCGRELPSTILSHFKIESTGAGECKLYWSSSIRKQLK